MYVLAHRLRSYLIWSLVFLPILQFPLAAAAPPKVVSQQMSCRSDGTSLSLDPKVSANLKLTNSTTGEAFHLSWEVAAIPPDADSYLVVGFPEAVRFSGDGFVALPPSARAPRSLKAELESSRMIVPLRHFSRTRNGSAEVSFFVSGAQQVRWSIVQLSTFEVNGCKEVTLAKGSIDIEIGVGAPRLLTQNRFADGTPKATYRSNDGRFLLLEFSDRYQVLDQESGDLLFDHGGKAPHFSHTGRYVTSFDDSGRLEISDVLAQKVFFTSSDYDIGNFGGVSIVGWLDGDGTVVLGYGLYGAVSLIFPLIEGRNIFTGDIGCHLCHAFGSTSISIDLDQLIFQAKQLDTYQASMLEVADSQSAIDSWEKSAPKDRGPPPLRPKFTVDHFSPLAFVADQFVIPSHGNDQDNFGWWFSDNIVITRGEVWNGDVKKERALLTSKTESMQKAAIDLETVRKARGRISRRTVAIGGVQVSPKNLVERLSDSLSEFHVAITVNSSVQALKPTTYSEADPDRRSKSAETILRRAMADASFGRPALSFRSQATPATHATTYFAKSYGNLPACERDEGPAQSRPWKAEGHEYEEPPIVSADRLIALWQIRLGEGQLWVAQQQEECASAQYRYGDLIAIYVPTDEKVPIKYRRLAASYSEAGIVSDPAGIDKDRSALGTSMSLTLGPRLLLSAIRDRFIILTSSDSGTASVFDIPSLNFVAKIEGMDSPLDMAAVEMTADLRNLVQINNSGLLAFYHLGDHDQILDGRYIDDELVLFDKSFRFESTPEGAAYVYLRIPGKTDLLTLDQFSGQLTSPGVAARALAGKVEPKSPIERISPPSLSVERRSHSFDIQGRSQIGLERFRVIVDGRVVQESNLNGALQFDQAITLDPGLKGRWANFILEDVAATRSNIRTFLLDKDPYTGSLRVLSYGADKFNGSFYKESKVPDLSFASGDARRFAEGVKQSIAPAYAAYFSTVLLASQTSKQDLVSTIQEAAVATKEGDSLMIFLASHGAVDGREFYLLMPSSPAKSEVETLNFSAIADALRPAQGRVFIFLDACHSAGAIQEVGSEQLASLSQNLTIVTASKGRQSSLENASWGGGAFTGGLLSAFKDATAPSTTGPPSIEALYASVRRTVSAQTGGRQTPWLRRSEWTGEQSLN